MFPFLWSSGAVRMDAGKSSVQLRVRMKTKSPGGLNDVQLIIGNKNFGLLETIPEVFPAALYQRCIVHFNRSIFSVTPRNRIKW